MSIAITKPEPDLSNGMWEFPKVRGALFWGPSNKNSTI